MPAERFYHDHPLELNDRIILGAQESRHLIKAMRIREGESVEIVNGKGILTKATVQHLDKQQARLLVVDRYEAPYPQNQVIIAQAIPRSSRLDYIVEKGCELGMDELWLFPGTLSEKKTIPKNQMERIQLLLISSMKQCGRLWMPEVKILSPLKEWKEFPRCQAYFGDLSKDAPPFQNTWTPSTTAIFFVGPEKGFTKEEILLLKNHEAKGVRLHENILRTDTAPIVALSLMKHWLMAQG